MSAPQFDIVFRGVRKGFDPSLVKAQFAALFKLDFARVERIFKSTRVTLKNNANQRLADIFVARLFAIGVVSDKHLIEPLVSKAIPLQDAGATSSEASSMHQPVDFLYGEHTRRIPFVFAGSGVGYCKIWLVNLLVCLLSAGILYPWAQVRSLRYFYQYTQLDNAAFNYSSNPQKIYLAQFALAVYFIALGYAFFYAPFYFLMGLLGLVALLPFYWFKSTAFQSEHTSYCHISFRQAATLGNSYRVFLVGPLVALLSAGLLAPYAIFKIQEYRARAQAIGSDKFEFCARLKNYWRLLPPLLFAEGVTFACVYWNSYLPFWLSVAMLSSIWLRVFLRWRVTLMNLQWNGTASKFGYFVSSWDFPSYRTLVLHNILFCVCTLGFYWPWARVRSAHFKASHLAFFANQRFKKWQGRVE